VTPSLLPVHEPPAAVANHLLALTGLRIFAALAVYFSHVGAPEGSPAWLERSLASGYYGVTVFFVLSGFVLSINYWDRLHSPSRRTLRSYGVARLARIYPLYLLVLLYVACRTKVGSGTVAGSWPWHAVGLQAWLPDVTESYAFGPAWSISVEIFLYATLPLIVLSLGWLTSVRQLVVATLLTIAAMLAVTWWFQHAGRADLAPADPGSAHRWLYRMPLTRIGDFLLGVLAARLYVALRDRPRVPSAGAALALVGVASIAFFSTQTWMATSAYTWDVGYAVPSAALILGLALAPVAPLSQLLAIPAIVLLGEASYAFYLIHFFVATPLGAGSWALALAPSTIALELMSLALVLAISIGLHVGLERPARGYVRKVLDPRRASPGPAPPAAPPPP
jgi:peptidoglycan/LPS O-acetylase OafA/YrhL